MSFIYGESDIVYLKARDLNWNQIGDYINENLDLIKLRHRFDEHLDVVYAESLPDYFEFDDTLELHNNFGMCATDKFTTRSEGLARIKVSLPINYDTAKYPTKVESETLQIASFTSPSTISPSYNRLFEDLTYLKQPVQQSKLFKQYYKEYVFKISYDSSLYWIFNGGTNYWADDICSMTQQISEDGYDIDIER